MLFSKLFAPLRYDMYFSPINYTLYEIENIDISEVVYDSRRAKKDTVFVCIRGIDKDGHSFAQSAYDNGARIFVVEKKLPLLFDAIQIICENTRRALAMLSASFFEYPAKKMKMIGITGTKGKTTTASLVGSILMNSGKSVGIIGTNGININGKITPTKNTTPESLDLHSTFAKMLNEGVQYVVMEVSSQAVYLDRIYGIDFDIGIFTNLYRDHIGEREHPSFEHYRASKAKFFESVKLGIFNADDKSTEHMLKNFHGERLFYSVESQTECMALAIVPYRSGAVFGTQFLCKTEQAQICVNIGIPGKFSVYNALCAICATRLLGISDEDITASLEKAAVKGRFENIQTPLENISFIIDYAHNGESLKSVISAILDYSPRRLIVVFGSVGERTRERRRDMAKAAEKADFCILTSDNPGKENPKEIISDIQVHMTAEYCVVIDRAEAIRRAVDIAADGDIVLFAGKGHEDYQLIGTEKIPFSERDIIIEAATNRAKRAFLDVETPGVFV